MAYINAYGMHKRNITYKKYTTNKICNECIRKIYQQYFENPIPENMPILEDLYDALLSQKRQKESQTALCCMYMVRRITLIIERM